MSVSVVDKPIVRVELRNKPEFGALLWPLAALVLAVMVLLPLVWLVVISFQSDSDTGYTVQNYIDAFGSPAARMAILNSLILSASVAAVSTAVGTALAWLITRTDMPGGKLIRALVLASFVTPSFLGAIAWILLASPNAGWINKLWTALSGSNASLVNIYSLSGAIFVMAIYTISYPFTLVSAALEQAPSEYENAARTLGAGLVRITRSITLPLVMPAIISGFILSFLESIASFGVPAFILIPARVPVMTIRLFSQFSEFPPRLGEAAAYGIPLLIVTALLLIIQRRILHRRSFTLITGKGGTFRRAGLGRWKWLALALSTIPPLLAVVLPYIAMLLVSLSRAWGRGPFAPGNLSLRWYYVTFIESNESRAAFEHSILYCAAAATLSLVVASLVAYIRARRLLPGSAVLGLIAMAPFAVPGIVLAIGFYAAYVHQPFRLVGTPWILIIAFATQFLPIAYSNALSMIGAISADLENAARILGAGRFRVIIGITAPLLRNALVSGWMLVFIVAFRELSTAIFLFVGSTATITTTIFDYTSSGNYEQLCALGIAMMVIVFTLVSLIYRVFGKRANRLQTSELVS